MAEIITQLLSKRRNRSSANSDDSVSSPESKKTRKTDSSTEEDDEIWTSLNMSQNLAGKLEEILEKLKKLDVIESSVKNIEAKLKSLEERTDVLENFRQTAEKDINDLKDGANFTSAQLNE